MTARGAWVLHEADRASPLTFHLPDGSDATLGRGDEAGLRVDRPLVSRRHCRVIAHPDGRLEVVDLDSTNGTFVNGRRVARAWLGPGDRLTVGRVAFRVTRV